MSAIKNAVIILVVLIGMVWVKNYFYGRDQFLAGEKAYQAGDMKEAIADYETAIHMYTPLSGYVPGSAERLWEIGRSLEKSGDYDWALVAYRSLRSSFYAVRSFYTPYSYWITRSDKEIEAVLAAQKKMNSKKPTGEPPVHE